MDNTTSSPRRQRGQVRQASQNNEIIEQLRSARQQRRLTQDQIAEATGLTRERIANLENYRGRADISELARYADVVDLKLALVPKETAM